MEFPGGPYSPIENEKSLYSNWLARGVFKADPTSSKPHYSILMPPPNLTGTPHIGHALQQTIMDIVARFKRMQGHDVLFQAGVDHAGIQFQGALEKKLKKEKGLTRQKMGREKFLEEAWKFKEASYSDNKKQFEMMGISADWSREVFTLDSKPTLAVYTQFKKFWDEGLIYKGPYIVQWCPGCGTAIEDVEVDYEDRESKLYFIKYALAEGSESLVIATTRPETYFADTAVAVNPTDERYSSFIGKEVILPQINRRIPVITDESVDIAFGSGVLKVTPAHDVHDYEIGKRHNLPLIAGVDKEGRLTEVAGEFAGLKTDEAREQVVAKLQAGGFLDKIETYKGSVAVCERCKSKVEPLISEEWFVRVKDMANKAIEVINNGEINFYPANFGGIITDWLTNIHDWCISRSLWWGHQIPVWYCEKCNPEHDPYNKRGVLVYIPKDFNDDPKTCLDCKGSNLTREPQVLDTWFSSGLWPLSTLGWPAETPELAAYFPFSFELSGGEIKFLWIARMIMLAEKHVANIPWKNQFFNGMLRDLKGQKFSKSLGNGIDPIELLDQFGTDVLRAVLTTYAAAGRDGRINKQLVIERCQNYRNFANKVWNASRFVYGSQRSENGSEIKEDRIQKTEDDIKMQGEVKRVTTEVTKHLESFNFHLALDEVYSSFWHVFCDWYLEVVKARLKGSDEASKQAAQIVLRESLLTYVKLLHPFMPFISEKIWRLFNEEFDILMSESWPK